ncbi:MAG TPA: hypothetical protein VGE16_16025 [Albitalea sp.]
MAVDRVDLLRASATLTGIDFIQVAPSQTELLVFLQHDVLPAGLANTLAALAASDFSIDGIGQVDPPLVQVLQNESPLPPPVDGRAVLRLTVDTPGGFGHYRLRIDSPAIDPYFNDVRFSFKAACDSELDCRQPEPPCPDEAPVDFPVDYRARDFWSFRQALMDFASQRYPDWQDRVEADVGMMVLELLAALGDEFAYSQDRLARESTLDSATQRRSLRHLARLVDYRLDDGSGAFAWLDVEASAVVTVDAGTPVCDAHAQVFFEVGKGLRDMPLAAPPLPPVPPVAYPVSPARNQLDAYIWDEDDTCLPAGSTTLTLQGAHAVDLQPEPLIDEAGRWVLLRTQPTSPDVPERRLAVRIVDARDDVDPLLALPITRIAWDVPTPFDLDLDTLVLRGNLLPATSGRTLTQRFRIGPVTDPLDPEPELPLALERIGTNSTLCYPQAGSAEDNASRVKFLFSLPGSRSTPLVWLPIASAGGIRMRPEVDLVRDGDGPWDWLDALVGEETAKPTHQVYTLEDGTYERVVGFERMGRLTQLADYASGEGHTLRFGDGEFGMVPTEGSRFTLRHRLGNGSRMNVAPDTLVQFPDGVPPGVAAVINPLAAAGGRDPETAEHIRTHAPQAFRALTYRAVQPADYEEIAGRLPWVQQAGAAVRWTGSWSTVFVTPDPRDEFGLSSAHRLELEELIDRVRMAGREAKVMDPRYADIDLEIRLCVAPNAYRGEVKQAALVALFGPHGGEGFFDPDNFRFGTPLSRAALIAALQAVPGVRAVEGMKVRRRGWFDWRDFDEFLLPVGVNELVRVANDRDLPERGAVRLVMEGGA